jgi:TonB family protein
LPAAFAVPQAASTAFVSYKLDASGAVSNALLYRSSGNSELDKAALACVPLSKQIPVLVNGKPAAVTMIGGVFWGAPFHSFGEPTPAGKPNLCNNRYPLIAVRLRQEGTVVVNAHIGTDGNVENPIITHSSGYPALDKASLDCITSHQYFPVTHNGQPVEIERTQTFKWRLQRPAAGPVVKLTFGPDGSVGMEGQKFLDADALRAKMAEISSRNPRPDVCVISMPGAGDWNSLAAMSHATHLLKDAGTPSTRFCTAPFAGMNQ